MSKKLKRTKEITIKISPRAYKQLEKEAKDEGYSIEDRAAFLIEWIALEHLKFNTRWNAFIELTQEWYDIKI